MPRLLELFCGTKSVGRAFKAAGWEVVSLDIVSKFEPTILCNIRSWDYTTFPPGHFDMVWASPVCAEYSRALTTRPRRLLKGDALVLSALEIIAHFDPSRGRREPGHRAAEDPAVHGASGLGGRDILQVRNSVQEADAAVDQHALKAAGSRCGAWQDGRHLRAAQPGPRLMEGQYERVSQSRELLYSVPAALCEAFRTRWLPPVQWNKSIFPCFCMFFWAVPLNTKNGEEKW